MTNALLGWDPVEVKLWLPAKAGVVPICRDSRLWRETWAGREEIADCISGAPRMNNRDRLRWQGLADHNVWDHLA
jgi:hypothetical protein